MDFKLTKRGSIKFDVNRIRFTNREVDVLSCIVGGITSTKPIAFLLGVSLNTVECYIRAISSKMGINSRREILSCIAKKSNYKYLQKRYHELCQNHSLKNEKKAAGYNFIQLEWLLSKAYLAEFSPIKIKWTSLFNNEKAAIFAVGILIGIFIGYVLGEFISRNFNGA